MSKRMIAACLIGLAFFGFGGLGAGTLDAQITRTPILLNPGNPSSSSFDPVISADSGRIYTAWTDHRTIGCGVYFSRSTDNGLTFAPEIRLDGDTANTTKDLISQSIHGDGSDVYLFWTDDRNGSTDVYFIASRNGGVSFEPEVRIDDTGAPGTQEVLAATLAADGQNVFIAMSVEIGGADEAIVVSTSSDGGASWSAAIHAGHGTAGDFDVDYIGIGCFGTNGFVAFDDNSDSTDSLYGRSLTSAGGMGTLVRVDSDTTGSGDIEHSVDVVFTSLTQVNVIWQEERTGTSNEEIRFNISSDGGAAFATDDVIGTYTPGTNDVDNVWFDAEGDTIIVAWEDNRTGSDEIYTCSSFDGGATWSADLQHSIVGGGYPRVAVDGDMVGVAWTGPTAPDHAFVNWSRDGGATFGAPLVMSAGTGDVDYVDIDLDATYESCHIAYLDDTLQGYGIDHVYTNSFRAASLTLMGSGASGAPHRFQFDGALAGESGSANAFQVVCSGSLGGFLIPTDGRNVGLAFDTLFSRSLGLGAVLSGSVNAAGSGQSSVFPMLPGLGTTFYAVAVVKLAGGGFGAITDPIEFTVQ